MRRFSALFVLCFLLRPEVVVASLAAKFATPTISFSQPEDQINAEGLITAELYRLENLTTPLHAVQVQVRQISGERRDPWGNRLPPFVSQQSIWAGQVLQITISDLATDAIFALISNDAIIGPYPTFTARIGKTAFEIPTQVGAGRGHTVSIPIQRLGRQWDDHTLHFETKDGTAQAGIDYTPASGKITFRKAESVKVIVIEIPPAAVLGRSFYVAVTNPDVSVVHRTYVINEGLAFPNANATEVQIRPKLSFGEDKYWLDSENRLRASVNLDGPAPTPINASILDNRGLHVLVTIPPGQTNRSFELGLSSANWLESVYLESDQQMGDVAYPTEAMIYPAGWDNNSTLIEICCDSPRAPRILEGEMGGFFLSWQGSLQESITFNYSTIDGTAVAGRDYVPVSGQVTFEKQTPFTEIPVQTLTDGEVEPRETFSFALSGLPANVYVRGATNTVIIDTSVEDSFVWLGLSGSEVGVEGDEREIYVSWNEPKTFRYFTTDLSARAGEDYQPLSGIVTNNASLNLPIKLLDDPVVESIKDFLFTVETIDEQPATNSVRIFIQDNEIATWQDPTFNFGVDPTATRVAVRADDSLVVLKDPGTLYLLDVNGAIIRTNSINIPDLETGSLRIVAMAVFADNQIIIGLSGPVYPGDPHLRLLREDGTFIETFRPQLPPGEIQDVEITRDQKY